MSSPNRPFSRQHCLVHMITSSIERNSIQCIRIIQKLLAFYKHGAYSIFRDTCRMCVCVRACVRVWMSIENYSLIFWPRIFISSGMSTLPMTQKCWKIFSVRASLWAGGPKRAKMSKIELLSQFFEWNDKTFWMNSSNHASKTLEE